MWPFLIGFIAAIVCYDLIFIHYYIVLFIVACFKYRSACYFFCGGVIGVLLTYSCIYAYKSTISEMPIGKVKVTGYISTIPSFNSSLCRFVLHTTSIAEKDIAANINTSWFSAKGCSVKAGEKWQMLLKIKHIHGSYSPRVADYAKNAIILNRHASAYVIKDSYNKIVGQSYYFLRLQDRLVQKYNSICKDCSHKELVSALLFGVTDKVTTDTWAIFQNTGTSHLFAISGLHVGIVGMMFFYFARWLWSLNMSYTAYIAAPYIGAAAALLAALFYSAISGFGVPALRCVSMLCLFLLLKIYKARLTGWKILLLSSCMMACYWPPLCWSKGFLLSFFAVLVLIFSSYTKTSSKSIYNKYLHSQVMINIGLLPFIILFWHKIVLASMPTNIFAIPLFSFIIVPLSFLIMLLMPVSSIAEPVAKIVDRSLDFSLQQLAVISKMPHNVIKISDFNDFEYVLIFLASILLLMPKGMPSRVIAWVLWLPILLPRPHHQVEYGNFSLTVLDVGQGTAALVKTYEHNLLFDTGPAFAGGYSAGEKVIWPYLEYLDLSVLDYVVISHPDLDHKGGLEKLKDYVTIKKGYSTDPTLFAPGIGEKCRIGQVWYMDGVRFEFVWPLDKKGLSKNNNSCVLRVSNAMSRALLTGDIEKKGESLLLQATSADLQSDILIAPHHGSRGASSQIFIDKVAPKYVVFTTGKYNKFHFPHSQVLKRYACGEKTLCLNTADTGTIMFWQANSGLQLDTWRHLNHHVWD